LIIKIENLQDYKEKKKIKRVVTDLEKASRVFSLTTKSVHGLKHYNPVNNVLSVIYDNQQLIEIYLKKYRQQLKDLQETR
jgi:hypothetical protein